MKRTVRLSLGMSFIMLALVLIAPHLASPKLVLRFLPKDVYEAGKDHPSPSLPKRLLCHLLLAMAAAYMVWAYKDVAEGIKRDRLSFGEAYKRLLAFLLVEKAFDICLPGSDPVYEHGLLPALLSGNERVQRMEKPILEQ